MNAKVSPLANTTGAAFGGLSAPLDHMEALHVEPTVGDVENVVANSEAPPRPVAPGVSGARSRARVNFSTANILMVHPPKTDILQKMLTGFGFKSLTSAHSAEDAWDRIENSKYDLIICDGAVGQGEIFDYVTDLRRKAPEPNRYCSTVVLIGHTPRRFVERARDCGANMVVAKPLRADVLLDRIIWIASAQRSFLETGSYSGPDRRFKNDGPPPKTSGRRKNDTDDLTVSEATSRNLDQIELDQLVTPTKVRL